MVKKKFIVSALAGILVLGGIGVAAPRHAAAEPVFGGQITYGTQTDPVNWNPHQNNQANAFLYLRNIFDTLLEKTENGDFVPSLAESYSVSDDGTVYTFRLRDGVTFHDGEKLDAAAVKLNLDKANETPYSIYAFPNYDSATVVDDRTVEVRLKKPDASFLDSIAYIGWGIISPKSLTEHLNDLPSGGQNLAGTGPFRISSYQKGAQVVLERFDDYNWAPETKAHQGKAYLDKVTYRFLAEPSSRVGALPAQVDVIEGISALDVSKFKDRDGFVYLSNDANGDTFKLSLNAFLSPLDDVRVRHALRDGFDLDALVKSLYRGEIRRAWSHTSPVSPFYDRSLEGAWGNNVENANKLLDEAGWTERDGEGFRVKDGKRLSVRVLYPTQLDREQRSTLLQGISQQLKQNIGLEFIVDLTPSSTYLKEVASGAVHIYPSTWLHSDVRKSLNGLSNGGALATDNKADPSIQPLKDLAAEALATSDNAQRIKIFHELQRKAVIDDVTYIPLLVQAYQIAASNKVNGLGFINQIGSPEGVYDVWVAK